MATYHNEKTLSEIALVNCFNKITANGIRTAEQLRQTEYYQEAIEAIYNFVRDAALKTKKSKACSRRPVWRLTMWRWASSLSTWRRTARSMPF